jgi:hypothetical protein
MDLVVLIDDPEANLEPTLFVQMIGDLLERETNFDVRAHCLFSCYIVVVKRRKAEADEQVKPLPKARIPIIKLNLKASPGLPFGAFSITKIKLDCTGDEELTRTIGIACDIGIENRLAIENTRLLLTYATIDPARVRTLVLFCAYPTSNMLLFPSYNAEFIYGEMLIPDSKSVGQAAANQFPLPRYPFLMYVLPFSACQPRSTH